ncbi:TfoX/Sxy family DNA transformation protein [Neisseria sp. Ec49-e6-T10]|uniref:TfoX/Sxy family DNA transformation protein n=1 Tax=Neisseria sp. Ec49-e6-T10 TaxID=3140744 RepID=UPI003EBE1E86
MTALNSLINIGNEMQRKLQTAGIADAEQLKALGAKEAFYQLKLRFPEVCLVHLYTLYGAIENIEYNKLSEETKKELKTYHNALKQ